MTKQTHDPCSNADLEFAGLLDRIVNKENGCVGRHSGWGPLGSLHKTAPSFGLAQDKGGESEESEYRGQSPPLPLPISRSKAQGGAPSKIAGPKGKRNAAPRAGRKTANLLEPHTGLVNTASDEEIPLASKGRRGTPSIISDPKGKRKAAPRASPKTANRLQSRTGSIGAAPDEERSSASKARRVQEEPLEVDETDVDSEPESPHSGSRGTLDSKIDGGNEEGNDQEAGIPAPNSPPGSMYWDGFLEAMLPMKGAKHGSVDEWYADASKKLSEHAAALRSRSGPC